jgi:hypothetical protein
VPSLPSLLLKIPDEFKPMAAIGIGALIMVLLVVFHGVSLHRILVLFKRGEIRLRTGRPHLGRAGLLFGWAIFLMLSLHILEIMTWAWFLVHLGLILRPTDAIYFCANAYTTLGYGTVDLGVNWRNISPIIAISGLFTFAWTTSSLVSIVASYLKLVEQLEQERLDQLALRAAARKAEWDLLTKEKESESAERLQTTKQVSGLSFFARRKVWKEEKQKEKELRAAERIEFQRLRKNERLAEDKLGKGPPPDDPEVNK